MHIIRLFAIIAASMALRAYFFHGWGLGDDPNYYSAIHTIETLGRVPLEESGYYYRLMYWVPLFIIQKTIGITELSFVAPIIAADLVTLVLVYAIGKTMGGEKVGLLSAAVLGMSPFDIAFSTAFSIDHIQSMFFCMAVLAHLFATKKGLSMRWLWVSAFAVLLSYLVTPKGVFIIPALLGMSALDTLKSRDRLMGHVAYAFIIVSLLGATMLADMHISGSPFGYFEGEKKMTFEIPLKWETLTEYPRLMFTDHPFGVMLFGLHFWILLPYLAYSLSSKARLALSSPLLFWFASVFAFTCFFPPHIIFSGLDMERFFAFQNFRYLAPLLPPSCILISFWTVRACEGKKRLFWLLVAGLFVMSLVHAIQTAGYSSDAQSDARVVREFLRHNDGDKVYMDIDLKMGVDRLTYGFKRPDHAIEVRRTASLGSIGRGIVISGGARNPFYGCPECSFIIGGRHIPENWELILERDEPLKPYRQERLRIWRAS